MPIRLGRCRRSRLPPGPLRSGHAPALLHPSRAAVPPLPGAVLGVALLSAPPLCVMPTPVVPRSPAGAGLRLLHPLAPWLRILLPPGLQHPCHCLHPYKQRRGPCSARAQGYISSVDRGKERSWHPASGRAGSCLAGGTYSCLKAPAREYDGLPSQGPALSQPAVAPGSRNKDMTPSSTQPPQRQVVCHPRHVCLLHTTARWWQRTIQLHPDP